MADEKAPVFILGPCILSFPAIFAPRVKAAEPGKPIKEGKYEGVFVFTKADRDSLREIKSASLDILCKKLGATPEIVQAKIAENGYNWPFKNVTDEPGYPEGGAILRGSSKYAPGVVSRYPVPGSNPPVPAPVSEASGKLYPGCLVRVSLRPYFYDATSQGGKKGIGLNINNVQVADDLPPAPRLDSRVSAEDEFEATTEMAPLPADGSGSLNAAGLAAAAAGGAAASLLD